MTPESYRETSHSGTEMEGILNAHHQSRGHCERERARADGHNARRDRERETASNKGARVQKTSREIKETTTGGEQLLAPLFPRPYK